MQRREFAILSARRFKLLLCLAPFAGLFYERNPAKQRTPLCVTAPSSLYSHTLFQSVA